jgi:hypothetical protein
VFRRLDVILSQINPFLKGSEDRVLHLLLLSLWIFSTSNILEFHNASEAGPVSVLRYLLSRVF